MKQHDPVGSLSTSRCNQTRGWHLGLLFPDPVFYKTRIYPTFLEDVSPVILLSKLLSSFYTSYYTFTIVREEELNIKDKVNRKIFCLDEDA